MISEHPGRKRTSGENGKRGQKLSSMWLVKESEHSSQDAATFLYAQQI